MPAHGPGIAVVFRHAQLNVGAGGSKVIADLLAQAGGGAGPVGPGEGTRIAGDLQQQRVTVGRFRVKTPAGVGVLPVKMIDEEIRRDPEAFQFGQHDGRPSIVRGARARVDGKMCRVVGITSLSRGISVRIMRNGI